MDSLNSSQSAATPSRLAITIIVVCGFFLVFKYLMNVSVSIMTPELMQTFHIKGLGLGLLGSTFLFTYLLFQLVSGLMLDSFSIRLLSTLAIAVSVLGLILFAWADQFWVALLGRGFQGVGAAFATVTYMKLTANWLHPRYFARTTGFVATAAMLGAILGDTPLSAINQALGWRAAIIMCMIFGIALMLVFWFVIRDCPRAPPSTELQSSGNFRIRWKDITHILSSPTNWCVLLYTGLAFSPVAVFASLWGNPFLHSVYHISTTDVPLYSTVMFIGLALGAPVLGAISDLLNNRQIVMFLSSAGSVFLMVLAIYCNNQPHWLLATELLLAGFTCGGFMLGFAIVKEANSIMVAATVVAFANTGDPVVGAWTDPLIGYILDRHWDHTLLNGAPIFSAHAYHLSMSVIILNLILACVFVALLGRFENKTYH